jgi:hypothetical protein
MVSNVTDGEYNETAVDVPTELITQYQLDVSGETGGQLIAELAADPNRFVGNPGTFNITTIGNIRKITGNNDNQFAEFFFRVYKREINTTTDIWLATSTTTGPVRTPLNEYLGFSASAIISNVTFLETDRIIIKYFGNMVGNAGSSYEFQFGGDNPVRTLIPVPVSVIPSADASGILVDTTNFNVDTILQPADDTVQAALERINKIYLSAGVEVSLTPPDPADSGDLWWRPDTARLFVYYNGQWVDTTYIVESVKGPTSSIDEGIALFDGVTGQIIKDSGLTISDIAYDHPTDGANTTITAANGTVLSAITVNDLGHTTSVSSKSLTTSDIPNLEAGKITSGRFDFNRMPTSATANRILKVGTANSSPTYTTLTDTDIPSLPAGKITSGILATAIGGTGRTDGYSIGVIENFANTPIKF